MKISYSLIFSLLLFSCSDKSEELEISDFSVDQFPQKWSLYKTSGMTPNSEITEEDLDYKQNYLFRDNNTFIKTRIENAETKTAEGTYILKLDSETQVYLLKFNEESDLIENCSADNSEYLYMDGDGKTLLSSWWSCDGPGLLYKQVSVK